MNAFDFRFAIISDPHIAVPQTIQNHKQRFHLVEVSIPALEQIADHLSRENIDFLLLPGDLTQHGEPENHAWLGKKLAALPFPTYVIPGNHDVPVWQRDGYSIGFSEFPGYYRYCGYGGENRLYYTQQILPGVRLIGLNSNIFHQDKQLGCLDGEQMEWLEGVLAEATEPLVMVMVHHNVIEHLPNQAQHPLGRRYMLDNAPELRQLLRRYGVQLVFTGHLHVQDVAYQDGLYDITTGSLVSYPHPYRICRFRQDERGQRSLQVESYHIQSVAGWENLPDISREWIGDRSHPFMMRLLTDHPLKFPETEAERLVPDLRYFWAHICQGDSLFDFSHFPPQARRYFENFGAIAAEGHLEFIDNHAVFLLESF
jgi:3',5'-cyclic AMP phosphodiesterase CpdA